MYTKLDLQYTVAKIPFFGIATLITIMIFFSYTQQAPSAYMAEMQLTTDERFKLTYEMRVPQIIELLDMSEQTLQKVDGCLLFDFAFDNCTVLYEVIIHQSWFPLQKTKIVTD